VSGNEESFSKNTSQVKMHSSRVSLQQQQQQEQQEQQQQQQQQQRE
jgi:hypothetical protein